MSAPAASTRDKKKKTASCMFWFPAAAAGDRRRQPQRHGQRVTTPQDTVVATLGYQGDGATFGSVSRSLGAPLPVLPPASRPRVTSALRDSHSSEGSGHQVAQPVPVGDADKGHAAAHQGTPLPDPRADAGEAIAYGHLPGHGSSLAQFTVGQSSLSEFTMARQDELEENDIMDIPIEIPSPTSTRVLVPSSLILRPSPKPSPPAANESAPRAHVNGDQGESASLKQKDLPPVPPRSNTMVARIARDMAARGVRLPMLVPMLKPGGRSVSLHNGWESVEDSGDENDWVTPIFEDPTVVLAAYRSDGMHDVHAATTRSELEESHGFFTSSSHPFSSSPVPQDRPNAKTSGSMMSAASTNAKTSGSIASAASANQFTWTPDDQNTASHQSGRGSPPPIREHWAADGARIRDRVKTDSPEHKSQRSRPQSVGGRTPSLPGRPPSPCLRPGTLKNLTSAFENHIRRFQVRKSA